MQGDCERVKGHAVQPEELSAGHSSRYVRIGSGNGLSPNRRQAIIWTDVDLFADACALSGIYELIKIIGLHNDFMR